jgi:hypothetical protein
MPLRHASGRPERRGGRFACQQGERLRSARAQERAAVRRPILQTRREIDRKDL